jgi:hypothetical protein
VIGPQVVLRTRSDLQARQALTEPVERRWLPTPDTGSGDTPVVVIDTALPVLVWTADDQIGGQPNRLNRLVRGAKKRSH